MNTRIYFIVAIALVIGALCAGLYIAKKSAVTQVDTRAKALAIIELCKAKNETGAHCYEREVPTLYGKIMLADTFDVIRNIRRNDPSFQFCHPLAHKLGEMTVAEDPKSWIKAIALNPPDGMCSNGFIHGVIVGRFRNEVLDDFKMQQAMGEFKTACEPRADWQPSALDQAICYHGMGHLFMFVTDGKYTRSLDACSQIAESPTGNFLRVCQEGVFMQTYQPLEPDDFALIEKLPEKPTRQNYRRICAQFSDANAVGACLREAWPLFQKELFVGTGMKTFCSGHPNALLENACYETVFAILGRQSQEPSKRDRVGAICTSVPERRQGKCFGSVARAFIEEDRSAVEQAVHVCEVAAKEAARNGCYQDVLNSVAFIYGQDTVTAARLCSLVPDTYRDECNNKIRHPLP